MAANANDSNVYSVSNSVINKMVKSPDFSMTLNLKAESAAPMPGGVCYRFKHVVGSSAKGEDIVISVMELNPKASIVDVSSESSSVIDFGKNQNNVDSILNYISDNLFKFSQLEEESISESDIKNHTDVSATYSPAYGSDKKDEIMLNNNSVEEKSDAEEPVENTTEKIAENPIEKVVEDEKEECVATSVEKIDEDVNEKNSEKFAEDVVEDVVEETAETPAEKVFENEAEECVETTDEQIVEDVSDGSSDENVEYSISEENDATADTDVFIAEGIEPVLYMTLSDIGLYSDGDKDINTIKNPLDDIELEEKHNVEESAETSSFTYDVNEVDSNNVYDSVNNYNDEPVEKVIESNEEVAEKVAEDTGDEVIEESDEEAGDEAGDEVIEEVADDTGDEVVEKVGDETTEENVSTVASAVDNNTDVTTSTENYRTETNVVGNNTTMGNFCGRCGSPLSSSFKFCSKCGLPNPRFEQKIYCGRCGKEAKVGDKFCIKCGNKLI